MRNTLIIFIFSLLFVPCVSGQKATVEECFKSPKTLFLTTPEPKSDQKLEDHFKTASKDLKKDERLFIYVYSQGSFGTKGLQMIKGAVNAHADYVLKSKKKFVVLSGGYRDEASIDVFVLNKSCSALANVEYMGDPSIGIESVDFVDAPLGLSVFPTKDEMQTLISKEVQGQSRTARPEYMTYYVIVGTDGKVMLMQPGFRFVPDLHGSEDVFNDSNQQLQNWVFSPPVIDEIPRHIRGTVLVRF